MVLHFVRDEKVIDSIIENFNSVDGGHMFVIFSKENDGHYNYISDKFARQNNVIEYNYLESNINQIINETKPNAILLHSLHIIFAREINKIKRDITIGWVVWGFDIYDLPKIQQNLLAKRTNRFYFNLNRNLKWEYLIKNNAILRTLYYKFILRKEDYLRTTFKAIKKIKYFCTYVEEDFLLFDKHYPSEIEYLETAFTSISQYLGGRAVISLNKDAGSILIGNSNTPESNHVDAFDIVRQSIGPDFSDRIYVPLSYGSNDIYRNFVIKEGEEIFQNSFHPILSFLDRNEYIDILKDCSVGVFYHFRQQAMGNIFAMLGMGARIYLSNRNPVFKFLKRIGLSVFDLENDFHLYLNTRLAQTEANKNLEILNARFDEKQIRQDLTNLTMTLSNAN